MTPLWLVLLGMAAITVEVGGLQAITSAFVEPARRDEWRKGEFPMVWGMLPELYDVPAWFRFDR